MDLSDLPQAARYRIAAAEIEADSILASSKATAGQNEAEAYRMGVDPSGLGFSPGRIPLDLARTALEEGRERAAAHLLGSTAKEYLNTGKLDIEEFNAKLDAIGDWILQKYHADRTALGLMKQECRKAALWKRAAALEAGESSEGAIGAKLPPEALVPMEADTAAFLADGGNKANRCAAIDAFILNCKQEISLKVNRKHIWLAAGHSTARQFQFWQASSSKATVQDAQNFGRILAMNPTDFKVLLKKRGII